MKKILKIVLWVFLFAVSFVCVDGICARYLKTRPILSKKEAVFSEISDVGVVYKSIFADVYYCDTIVEYYNAEGQMDLEKEVRRYYEKKNSDFVCDVYLSDTTQFEESKVGLEYMQIKAEGIYKAGYSSESYNKKLNLFTYNFVGTSKATDAYQDVYMFDVRDFSKEPIKLVVDGFDVAWRTNSIQYSPSGNIMVFYYSCGYRPEQWMGEQKYTEEECIQNSKDNGIYVFKVNGINDYTLLSHFSESRNPYKKEYRDSYFRIDRVLDDENVLIQYLVTNNKQEEPTDVVYYVWNIVDDTLTEWQV